jgi:CysZ protein
MAALWARPESAWVLWLWHLLAWLLTLVLVGLSVLFAYLLSQILFNVFIMDVMSRITERMITGGVVEAEQMSFFHLFVFLIKQEIPRAIAPVGVSLVILFLGWFTPLGPVLVPLSSAAAIVFLAWDNTDLTPARRARPFPERWGLLKRSLLFHLGFGLPFLVPGLNLLFLAFAPVGATLYYLDRAGGAGP